MRLNSIILLFVIISLAKCTVSEEFTDLNFFENGNFLKKIASEYSEQNLSRLDAKCLFDIIFVIQNLQSEKWAMQMIDSTGKLPSGLLKININSLGDYDECISSQYINETIGKNIKGKYCSLRIPLTDPPTKIYRKVRLPPENPLIRVGNIDPLGRIFFKLGICIPQSCEGSQILNFLKSVHQESKQLPALSIVEEFCSTIDPTPWNGADWAAVAFFLFFAILIILSTAYDAYMRVFTDDGRNEILVSFSLWTNTKRLFTLNPSSLKCLHGIRALTMLWIILGHRYLVELYFPMSNIIEGFQWTTTYESMIFMAGTVSVDTFLFLSGMLISYIFFKQMEKKTSFSIGVFYLHRILRLTPALIAIVFFTATFFRHLGNGPLWHELTDIISQSCLDQWWISILYLQNYIKVKTMCAGHTWYLGVDMQLYILSPILLYPLWKNVKRGLVNYAFWCLVAFTTITTIVYINDWPAGMFNTSPAGLTKQEQYYIPTHTRALPWLIGFGFGYLLHTIAKKRIVLNKLSVILLWTSSLAIMAAVIFGAEPLNQFDHIPNKLEDGTYNAYSRSAWTIAVAGVIFACVNGYGGPVNWFLSLPCWEVLGRLSYTMYLCHVNIQYWFMARRKTVGVFDHQNILYQFGGDIFFVTFVAYLFSMAFEFPVTVLEKLVFKNGKKSHPSKEQLEPQKDFKLQDEENTR